MSPLAGLLMSAELLSAAAGFRWARGDPGDSMVAAARVCQRPLILVEREVDLEAAARMFLVVLGQELRSLFMACPNFSRISEGLGEEDRGLFSASASAPTFPATEVVVAVERS